MRHSLASQTDTQNLHRNAIHVTISIQYRIVYNLAKQTTTVLIYFTVADSRAHTPQSILLPPYMVGIFKYIQYTLYSTVVL